MPVLEPEEKAHGPRHGPFHPAKARKVRENADAASRAEIFKNPCK
jgi:hypothetical protein